MPLRRLIFLMLLMASVQASAQKITVSGYVTNSVSGERMINAAVYEKASYVGTTTNNYGFYSLPLSPGKAEIVVSYLGYEALNMSLSLTRDTVMNFGLNMSVSEIGEVTVTASGTPGKGGELADEHDRYTDGKIRHAAGDLRRG